MKKEYTIGETLLASLWCFLYFLVFLLLPSIVNVLFGAWVDMAFAGTPEDIEKVKTDNGTLVVMLGYILTVGIFAIYFALRKSSVLKEAKINKIKPRLGIDSALLGVGMLGAFQAIVSLIALVAPKEWIEAQSSHSASILNGNLLVAILYTVIVAPVCEELVFRGLMLSSLKDKAPKWVAIIAVAFVFGIIHSFPIGFIYAFSLGLLLGWLFYYTGSLLPCIIVHMLFNASNYLAYIPKGIGIYVAMAISIPLIIYSIIDILKYCKKTRG